MKISNETKVGALTAIAITLLILGFNFLKGKTILKTGNYLHAKYTDTKGIMISNPVYINGFQVGSVADIFLAVFGDKIPDLNDAIGVLSSGATQVKVCQLRIVRVLLVLLDYSETSYKRLSPKG